jgi:hypothetical protein
VPRHRAHAVQAGPGAAPGLRCPGAAMGGRDYQPVPGGIVEVRAAVAERPRIEPPGASPPRGDSAVAQNEVGLEIATPTGAVSSGAEAGAGSMPACARSFAWPARGSGHPGVVGVGGAVEQFRFALDTAQGEVFEESRRSASAGFGAWGRPGTSSAPCASSDGRGPPVPGRLRQRRNPRSG